jgi:organic hydroperoxide reductase OsmC/OhrA
MEPKKAYKVFRYENEVCWESARRGTISSAGKPDVAVASPPEFKGEAGRWTPEDLFLASVNLCTMLTFVAYAQHRGLDFAGYQSDAEGTLENVDGKYRFTEIVLHPHVRLKSAEDAGRARELLENAHRDCFVSNSVSTTIKVFPDFRAE